MREDVTVNVSSNAIHEFKGQIVDIFEDFASDNNINIPNEERNDEIQDAKTDGIDAEELDLAIIYGKDYDTIADVVEDAVRERITDTCAFNHPDTKFTKSEMSEITKNIINAFKSLIPDYDLGYHNIKEITDAIEDTFARWNLYGKNYTITYAVQGTFTTTVNAASIESAIKYAMSKTDHIVHYADFGDIKSKTCFVSKIETEHNGK